MNERFMLSLVNRNGSGISENIDWGEWGKGLSGMGNVIRKEIRIYWV